MEKDQTVAAFTGPHPPLAEGDYVPYVNITREAGTGRVRITVRGLQNGRGKPTPEAHIWMDPVQFRSFAVDICANELSD